MVCIHLWYKKEILNKQIILDNMIFNSDSYQTLSVHVSGLEELCRSFEFSEMGRVF